MPRAAIIVENDNGLKVAIFFSCLLLLDDSQPRAKYLKLFCRGLLVFSRASATYHASGCIAVARLSQGYRPSTALVPARGAEGFWRNVKSPKVFRLTAALHSGLSTAAR
jgi:hypothetical protein